MNNFTMSNHIRNLHPMFSIAYVKRFKDGKKHRSKGTSQRIKCILVGND